MTCNHVFVYCFPLTKPRKVTRRQAEELQQHYEDTLDERDDIHGGDIVEYDE